MSDGDYTNVHRALLQYIIAMGCVRGHVVLTSLSKLIETSTDEEDPLRGAPCSDQMARLDRYVREINRKLKWANFEIRRTMEQVTREFYYSFVNLLSDDPTQRATELTVAEIVYFKRILDYMFGDANNEINIGGVVAINEVFCVGSNKALNLETSRSKTDTKKTLDILVDHGWLQLSDNHVYSLGVRALGELREYLKSRYGRSEDHEENDENDDNFILRKCFVCHEILTTGIRCGNLECGARFHPECGKLHFETMDQEMCPVEGCRSNWANHNFYSVGEKAIRLYNKEL